MSLIKQIDRDRVGGQLTRWKQLMASGAFGDMTDSEAYDAVYLTTMHPDHKRDRLESIKRITK